MMMSNISNINVEQAQFTAVVSREADREASDGAGLARACMLGEMLGAVFGAITLWYLVISFGALV
jgi:hypothetical protein